MSDLPGAAAKLARAVTFRTVSYGPQRPADPKALGALYAFLRRAFPRAHRSLSVRKLGDYALLYEWQGADSSLEPALFVAHTDVVPAEEPAQPQRKGPAHGSPARGAAPAVGELAAGEEEEAPPAGRDDRATSLPAGEAAGWTHPPFGGVIADGYVWGRGTLDCKHTVVALLEAVEQLLESEFAPQRTVYLAFGGDEELSGRRGAGLVVAHLEDRGVTLDCVLDEGGVILEDFLSGSARPVALIGTAEKGVVDLELSVRSSGGHAAMPPRHTAAGILGRALWRLESRPLPSRLTPALRQSLTALAELSTGPKRGLLRHLRLSWPLMRTFLASSPDTDSLVRTTRALTVLEGSEKDNVLPHVARAVVNVRLLPGDSVAWVVERTRALFRGAGFRGADGRPAVEVRVLGGGGGEPVPASALDTPAYRALVAALGRVHPQAAAVPFIFTMATDSRHYQKLTRAIYRFQPVVLKRRELARIHGVDERIPLDGVQKLVEFYRLFIRDHCGKETP